MGEAELDPVNQRLVIYSEIITYGKAADDPVTERMRSEIESLWNEPEAVISIKRTEFRVEFIIQGFCNPGINADEIIQNLDPRKNFFRIEEYAVGNISFVDGIGCNSGYFKLENLYEGSTTAAHEYGHSLGLDHPLHLDIRGGGRPGIMYPRGTWVDPPYQYDPAANPGAPGGTMHPMHRRVRVEDILQLRLHRLSYKNGKSILGAFTNLYHPDHGDLYQRTWVT